MLKNTKIQKIFIILLVLVLIGVFLYFHNSGEKKKVELSLAQNSAEQKAAEEGADSQNKTANTVEKTEDVPASDIESSQPTEAAKDESAQDKPVVSEVPQDVKSTRLSITNHLVSWGFQKSSSRKIDTIIVHSSYDAIGDNPYDVSGVIAEYKSYGVSPHYLIDRKGAVYRLVEDQNIAYHAGESQMPDGRTGVNAFSLGIEMLTTKKDKLTEAQYSALNQLIVYLKGKYPISNILGHNQIAPGRKDDPWNFDWKIVKK